MTFKTTLTPPRSRTERTMTNKEIMELLNEIGPPAHDHPENGGRVSWRMVERYGEWLYRHDKTAFYCAKQEVTTAYKNPTKS